MIQNFIHYDETYNNYIQWIGFNLPGIDSHYLSSTSVPNGIGAALQLIDGVFHTSLDESRQAVADGDDVVECPPAGTSQQDYIAVACSIEPETNAFTCSVSGVPADF